MKKYRRARAAAIVAGIFAVLTVATGFPLATLLHQRTEIAGAVRELERVNAHNAALAREVKSLSTRSTIVGIARLDYGLVQKGERAVVILPGKNERSAQAPSLTPTRLPASDFVPTAATTWETPSASGSAGSGFWERVLHHLEFWRGVL